VGAELGWIEPDASDPFVYEPGVLLRRQSVWTIATAGEQDCPGFRAVVRRYSSMARRVWSVSSNLTDRPVFFCRMVARSMA
jgi:hypothetical protein